MSYYDDLGLPPSATQHEIRNRYRELAMVAHPDHGGDPIVFRLLTEAYAVLGERAKRDAALASATARFKDQPKVLSALRQAADTPAQKIAPPEGVKP